MANISIEEAKAMMSGEAISKLKDIVTPQPIVNMNQKVNNDIIMSALCRAVSDDVIHMSSIDDKIIKRYISYFLYNYAHRSNERNIPFDELARKYEMEFWDDMATLGCHKPDVITRVSEVYWFCCFLYKVVYSRDYRDD